MDQEKIKHAVSELLEAFGEDPQREGLKETPQRVAKMYAEIFASLNHQPEGLSKIPRLVDFVAKKPGMQERLTTELANELQRILNPKGIAIKVAARHMCMEMRGINKAGQFTYTSKFTGEFKDDLALRKEFLMQTKDLVK